MKILEGKIFFKIWGKQILSFPMKIPKKAFFNEKKPHPKIFFKIQGEVLPPKISPISGGGGLSHMTNGIISLKSWGGGRKVGAIFPKSRENENEEEKNAPCTITLKIY